MMGRWTRGLLTGAQVTGCSSAQIEAPTESVESTLRLAAPTVTASAGAFRGTVEGSAHAFKGIRYGTVPVRFASPAVAAPVAGVVDAMAYGSSCLQRVERNPPPGSPAGTPATFEIVGDEDCLFLNVWAPADRRPDERLPVMFFVHGGAYVTGGSNYNPWFYAGAPGTTDLYNGADIASSSRVVVVTINYRLGSVGFTAHPALSREHGGGSGNAGLEDMRLALQWVQSNVGSFGGDPSRVMTFGESAGAWSACTLLASPTTRGLFSRAGMESMYCASRTLAAAEQTGSTLAAQLGCSNAGNVLACMRSKTKEELMAAQGPGGSLGAGGGYLPTVDGQFLPAAPLDIIKRGAHNRMPVLIGHNAKEAGFAKLVPTIPQTFPELAQLIATTPQFAPQAPALTRFYGRTNFTTAPDALVALLTDVAMTCPQRQSVRALTAAQSEPVYRFVFDANVPAFFGTLGAIESFHGAELFYVFQKLNELPAGLPSGSQMILERRMLDYWTSFAATTRPYALGAPTWFPYAAGFDNALELSENPKTLLGYHAEGCTAIDQLGLGL